MKTEHKETQEGWGVLVTLPDEFAYLSSGEIGRMFISKLDAKAWMDGLANNLSPECKLKVVKVHATWEVIQ